MAHKDRLKGISYTCANRRFQTDITKGHPHGTGQAGGSVFNQAVLPAQAGGGYSLWLEHVVDTLDQRDVFGLMWYDKNGDPTIPLSGVFEADDIRTISGRLADFIRVP